jgi:hypothetical protein
MKLLFALVLAYFVSAPAQIFNTSLTVTVRDELGNLVPDASVRLFEKEEDYTKEQNAAEEATTDAKGVVKFKKLKPLAYFILCRKGDKDNTGGGERMGKLEDGKFNKITVVIQ